MKWTNPSCSGQPCANACCPKATASSSLLSCSASSAFKQSALAPSESSRSRHHRIKQSILLAGERRPRTVPRRERLRRRAHLPLADIQVAGQRLKQQPGFLQAVGSAAREFLCPDFKLGRRGQGPDDRI